MNLPFWSAECMFSWTALYLKWVIRSQIFTIFDSLHNIEVRWPDKERLIKERWSRQSGIDAVVGYGIILRRDGRVVECGGLENRCSPSGEPGVRIPLSPQPKITPSAKLGDFYFQITEPGLPERGNMKIKRPYEWNEYGSNLWLQGSPSGITTEQREVVILPGRLPPNPSPKREGLNSLLIN